MIHRVFAAMLVMASAVPAWADAGGKVVAAKPVAGAGAGNWTVVPAQSEIAFSGSHAGRTFRGVFQKWSAAIRFDPAKLADANATVRIDLASSRTGDKTYDETLPGDDWFNLKKTPVAMFQSTRFRDNGPGKYIADGILTLRDVKVAVSLPFGLTIKGNMASMSGQLTLKRMAYGLGKGSDPAGDWVGLDIPVTIKVTAIRKN
jgi:polyisoprenoid-binding protein YceI